MKGVIIGFIKNSIPIVDTRLNKNSNQSISIVESQLQVIGSNLRHSHLIALGKNYKLKAI